MLRKRQKTHRNLSIKDNGDERICLFGLFYFFQSERKGGTLAGASHQGEVQSAPAGISGLLKRTEPWAKMSGLILAHHPPGVWITKRGGCN